MRAEIGRSRSGRVAVGGGEWVRVRFVTRYEDVSTTIVWAGGISERLREKMGGMRGECMLVNGEGSCPDRRRLIMSLESEAESSRLRGGGGGESVR